MKTRALTAALLGVGLLIAGSSLAQVTISGGGTVSGGATIGTGVAPAACPALSPSVRLSFVGTQGFDCMRTIWHPTTWDRRGDIAYGQDLGQQKLTTDCNVPGCGNIVAAIPPGTADAPGSHPSAVLTGNAAVGGIVRAWVSAYDPIAHPTFGDGETCSLFLPSEINGDKGGGVATLITEGSNQVSGACGAGDGGAYIYTAGVAKGTSTARLESVNLCTGARTLLASTALICNGITCLDTYGDLPARSNCDHNRGQADWHEYCMWTQVCLQTAQSGGNISFTGRIWRIGKASGWVKGDAENNDPGAPSGTTTYTRYLVGTTLFGPVARASNINPVAMVGISGTAGNGTTMKVSVTNFGFSTSPQP